MMIMIDSVHIFLYKTEYRSGHFRIYLSCLD